jgi:hypothetical protein
MQRKMVVRSSNDFLHSCLDHRPVDKIARDSMWTVDERKKERRMINITTTGSFSKPLLMFIELGALAVEQHWQNPCLSDPGT